MLLLMDLDNTLVDRDAAFARWARGFLTEHGGSGADLDWLLETDAHGYTHRAVLADGLIQRLRLTVPREELVRTLLADVVPGIRCYDGVPERLAALRAQGHRLVVVTNGTIQQQSRKITEAALGEAVDEVVISEAVGAKKPHPDIFTSALRSQAPQEVAWMIGDHAVNDIGGGRDAGCRTAWISHGQDWPGGPTPTLSASAPAAVLDLILAEHPPTPGP